MTIENLLFVLFCFALILSALFAISMKNSLYSVLFLILCFLFASGILIILECEFLALLFLIIYVGAIAILFLFVIMMLSLKISNSTKNLLKYIPIGSFVGFILLFELILLMCKDFSENAYDNFFFFNILINWLNKLDSCFDIETFGLLLYTYFLVQFLISGCILLLAIFGSVVIAMDTNTSSKSRLILNKNQFFFKQISRQSKNIY